MDNLQTRFKQFLDFGKDYDLAAAYLGIQSHADDVSAWFTELKSEEKNTKLSNDNREEANSLYLQSKFSEVYPKLKESLRYGRLDDENNPLNTAPGCTLSAAFRNRATVHLYDRKFDECITDVEMAIECGYPAKLQHNLYLTKARAYIGKQEKVLALQCAQKVVALLAEHGAELQSNMQQKLESIMREAAPLPPSMTEFVEEMLDGYLGPVHNPVRFFKLTNNLGCNCPHQNRLACEDVSCTLNDNVEIRYGDAMGRGLFLKKDVSKDGVIFAEKSVASLISRAQDDVKCNYCMDFLTLSCFPCKYCPTVFFCRRECAEEAWVGYHRFECGYLKNLRELKNYSRMSYRVFTQTNPSEVLDVLCSLGSAVQNMGVLGGGDADTSSLNSPMEGFKDGVYQAKNYYSLFHLDAGTRTHEMNANIPALTLCLKLLRLYESKCETLGLSHDWDLNLVRLTDGSVVTRTLTDKRALQLALLLHHYKQATNHNLVKLQNRKVRNTKQDFRDHRDGLSPARLFPVVGLMNHAHDPTVKEEFDCDTFVYTLYRASRDMKAGEELTMDYDRMDDMVSGSTLNFSCLCELCAPTHELDVFSVDIMYCELCVEVLPPEIRNPESPAKPHILHAHCRDRNGVLIAMSAFDEYLSGLTAVEEEDFAGAIPYFESCIRIRLIEELVEFSPLLLMSWMALSTLHAKLGGNWDEVVHYTKQILDIYDKYPRVKAFKFTGEAARLHALGLEHEISRLRKEGKFDEAEAYADNLRKVQKRGPSGEVVEEYVSNGFTRVPVGMFQTIMDDDHLDEREGESMQHPFFGLF